MRYVAVLASAVALFMLVAALPMQFSDDSDATTYVDPTETITFAGYAMFSGSNDVLPQIFVFVVIYDTTEDCYYYENVADNTILRGTVAGDTGSNKTSYFFSVEVPLITSPQAEYYICAFNNYKIGTVSSLIEDSTQTISPDPDNWEPTVVTYDYDAVMIKRTTWATADPDEPIYITGGYNELDDTVSMDRISLIGSRGTITGHVNGIVGNSTTDLNDVLVQFYSGDRLVDSARTDSHGDYEAQLPTGDYTVKFSRGNYECEPISITVTEGTHVAPSVSMTMTVDNSFLGFDIAHFMTILGGIVCAVLIVMSVAFQIRRIKHNKSGKDWILDDMDDGEEEE